MLILSWPNGARAGSVISDAADQHSWIGVSIRFPLIGTSEGGCSSGKADLRLSSLSALRLRQR